MLFTGSGGSALQSGCCESLIWLTCTESKGWCRATLKDDVVGGFWYWARFCCALCTAGRTGSLGSGGWASSPDDEAAVSVAVANGCCWAARAIALVLAKKIKYQI